MSATTIMNASSIQQWDKLPRGMSWADASTDEEDSAPSDPSFGADTDAEDVCSSSETSSPAQRPMSAEAVKPARWQPKRPSRTPLNSKAAAAGKPASWQPERPPRTPLNSKAALWEPAGNDALCVECEDPLPYIFGQEATWVVSSLQALEHGNLARKVEVEYDADGFSVSIQISNMSKYQKVVSAAQRALLDASSQSTCTYVLGYLWKPFSEEPDGFRAVLGAMRDESCSCFEAYGHGFCANYEKGRCALLHPGFKSTLKVSVWAS